MISVLLPYLCICTASYYTMLWIFADRLYRIGVPFAAVLAAFLVRSTETLAFLSGWGDGLVLAAAVCMPILFEKKHRRSLLSSLTFAVSAFGFSAYLAESLRQELLTSGAFRQPFGSFFLLMAYAVWCAGLHILLRHTQQARERLVEAALMPRRDPEQHIRCLVMLLIWGVVSVIPAVTAPPRLVLVPVFAFAFAAGLLGTCSVLSAEGTSESNTQTESSIEEMRKLMFTVRAQRHDYNIHVHTLRGLLQEGRYEECQRYLDALTEDTVRTNQILGVHDPAVCAEIFAFWQQAQAKHIPMEIEILNDMANLATSPYETNKILGNLLQNAIDECETACDGSGLRLSVFKRGEYCLICVSNPLHDPERTHSLAEGETTKTAGHEGVGLASIKLLAARYNGLVYHKIVDNTITCTAKIPLKIIREDAYGKSV